MFTFHSVLDTDCTPPPAPEQGIECAGLETLSILQVRTQGVTSMPTDDKCTGALQRAVQQTITLLVDI